MTCASVTVRAATTDDAAGMARVLRATVDPARRPTDPGRVRAQYVAHPDTVRCSLAVDADGTILGFQSLKRATPGNPSDLPDGWGIVGTDVHPDASRRGIGAALFAATRAAALAAGLTSIDATIGAANARAQSYYAAMGFRDWRERPGSVCRRFDLAGDDPC